MFVAFPVSADHADVAFVGAVHPVERFAFGELGFDLLDLFLCHGGVVSFVFGRTIKPEKSGKVQTKTAKLAERTQLKSDRRTVFCAAAAVLI